MVAVPSSLSLLASWGKPVGAELATSVSATRRRYVSGSPSRTRAVSAGRSASRGWMAV